VRGGAHGERVFGWRYEGEFEINKVRVGWRRTDMEM
jgi:hypothetical protein